MEAVTEFPERLAAGARLRWSRGAAARDLRIGSARSRGQGLLLRFEGIETAESARELTGGELTVDAERVPAAPADFLYSHEIEGWACENARGAVLGRARDLERTLAGPMLSIETASGREALVPFVWPIVVAVDRPRRRIVLDPPEGLLEL